MSGMPVCSKCGKQMIVKANRRTGDLFHGCPNFPVCKETKPVDLDGDPSAIAWGQQPVKNTSHRQKSFQRDEFVYVRHRGYGKVLLVEDGEIEVEFFNDPSDGGREVEYFPVRSPKVRKKSPPEGQRCFYTVEGEWCAGVIKSVSDREVTVAPVLDEWHRIFVPKRNVYIRCLGRPSNPLEVIKSGVIERPEHAKSRAAFIDAALRIRSASRGLTGLVSSRVELHRHQVEIVSRVLRDPIQRYLLADEVGLGKTIEAGAIVRQFLLDNEDAKVEFLLPPLLLEQWRTELQEKFSLDEERLIFSQQGSDWIPKKSMSKFLVVDEAHHIAAHAFSEIPSEKVLYTRLSEESKRVENLLLLSATPLLHNEMAFLGLLHLLDPLLYPLDELEAFKSRVEGRRDLAKRYSAFQPSSMDFILQTHLSAFKERFPEDELLSERLDEVERSLSVGITVEDRSQAIRRARAHISETYKLHRRVLRTRRGSPLAKGFPVRGREKPIISLFEDELGEQLESWLREWLNLMAVRKVNGVFDESAESVLLGILDRWQLSPSVLLKYVRTLIDLGSNQGTSLTTVELDEIQNFKTGTDERSHLEVLAAILGESGSSAWLPTLIEKIRETPAKTVVFCGDTETAHLVADGIERNLSLNFEIARYIESSREDSDTEAEVSRFRNGEARYLICDSAAEEGRNFQFASAAFHVNLPWNPNRIEQRIGRIDRFSSGGPVQSYVFVRPGSVAKEWLELLSEGFGVFSDSIASLQHALSGSISKALNLLVEEGPSGLTGFTLELRESLKKEFKDILELENLEAIEEESRLTQGVFDELSEVESDPSSLERPTVKWLSGTGRNIGGIGLESMPNLQNRSFFRFVHPQKSALSMPLEVVDSHLSDFLGLQVVFDRKEACRTGEGVLMRPGAAFFDAIEGLTRSDDLGQTFGFWRKSYLGREPLLIPQFAFRATAAEPESIQGSLSSISQNQRKILMRSRDGFFPPKSVQISMDCDGGDLSLELQELVAPPFGISDRPLNPSDLKQIGEHFDIDWPRWWENKFEAAMSAAHSDVGLDQAKTKAISQAKERFEVAVRQMELRLEKETDEGQQRDFRGAIEQLNFFRDGAVKVVENVQIELEVVGLVLVASAGSDIISGQETNEY